MIRLALYCQIAITVLQFGAALGWGISREYLQCLFWLGLAVCNVAYVLMVWR